MQLFGFSILCLVGMSTGSPTAPNPSFLQLPSDFETTAGNSTNRTSNTSKVWPEENWFHLTGDLYLHIAKYGFQLDDAYESLVLHALEAISHRLEPSGGPYDKWINPFYTWSWSHLQIQLHISLPQPVSLETRKRVSMAVDVVAGLTMLYGPRELKRIEMRPKNGGIMAVLSLFMRIREPLGLASTASEKR